MLPECLIINSTISKFHNVPRSVSLPGNTAVGKLLLQHGADVHSKDKFGLTPLMIAASKDNLELIQELENHGAKFNVSVTHAPLYHLS